MNSWLPLPLRYTWFRSHGSSYSSNSCAIREFVRGGRIRGVSSEQLITVRAVPWLDAPYDSCTCALFPFVVLGPSGSIRVSVHSAGTPSIIRDESPIALLRACAVQVTLSGHVGGYSSIRSHSVRNCAQPLLLAACCLVHRCRLQFD